MSQNITATEIMRRMALPYTPDPGSPAQKTLTNAITAILNPVLRKLSAITQRRSKMDRDETDRDFLPDLDPFDAEAAKFGDHPKDETYDDCCPEPAQKEYHGPLPLPTKRERAMAAAAGMPEDYYAGATAKGEHDPLNQNTTEVGTGLRADAGKLRYDLIPVGPLAELARVYTLGHAKYPPKPGEQANWRGGIAYGNSIAAMMRHIEQWRSGEKSDAGGQHHMASVAFWALAIMQFDMDQQEGAPEDVGGAKRAFMFSPIAL